MKKNTTNNNATTNNTSVKEETIMKTRTLEELIVATTNITKTSEAGYATNAELKEALGVGKNNKMKRAELIELLHHTFKYKTEGDELESHETGVPVGDLDITHDNAPAEPLNVPEEVREEPKFVRCLRRIDEEGKKNIKHEFGYSITPFMLQAVILEVAHNIPKLSGHTVTPEENETTKRTYQWLRTHKIIEPCVFSVKENDKVRVYMPCHTGRTTSDKTTMIPYDKSKGYTANRVTSYAINEDNLMKAIRDNQ